MSTHENGAAGTNTDHHARVVGGTAENQSQTPPDGLDSPTLLQRAEAWHQAPERGPVAKRKRPDPVPTRYAVPPLVSPTDPWRPAA